MMKIRYFNKGTGLMIEKDIPSDVCQITVPAQEGQPEVKVDVNTDAVIVTDSETDKRIGMLTYTELQAEAAQDA
jgi:hypothetical protein